MAIKIFAYISPICREAPLGQIYMKFCVRGRLADVINRAKFYLNQIRGFDSAGVWLSHKKEKSPLTQGLNYRSACDDAHDASPWWRRRYDVSANQSSNWNIFILKIQIYSRAAATKWYPKQNEKKTCSDTDVVCVYHHHHHVRLIKVDNCSVLRNITRKYVLKYLNICKKNCYVVCL